MVTTYGVTNTLKTGWLMRSDTDDDAALDIFLDSAAVETDNLARPWVSVPLTGANLTADVRFLNEKMAAGLFLQARVQDDPSQKMGSRWVDEARRGLEEYFSSLFADSKAVSVALSYRTSPLKDDEDGDIQEGP